MEFWESGQVLTFLLIALLLITGRLLRQLGPLGRIGLPASILGGCLGLLLGEGALDVLPLDQGTLESVVYHGLAIVFIAVSLQTPTEKGRPGGAISFAFGIPLFLGVQAIIGMLVVLTMSLHPGFGLLLPLGFEQGPGQALSLGRAWEADGLVNGGQLGLIIAALGFGWAIIGGVPLAAWGRARGLLSTQGEAASAQTAAASTAEQVDAPGSLDPLTRHLVVIGVVYLMTYAVVAGLAALLADKPRIAAMAWGFHFIFGALIAIGMRKLLHRVSPAFLSNDRLSNVAGLTVDVVTCAAICAVQISIFQANLLPLIVLTSLGGMLTLVAAVWLSARAFPRAPFEHALLLFGAATGTLPVGLALLRIVDPHFKTPASLNAVLGSALSVPLAAVFMIGLLPYAVGGYPDAYPSRGFIALGLFALYTVVLLVLWRLLGPLRSKGSPLSLWPLEKR